jgi:hypothetical protein
MHRQRHKPTENTEEPEQSVLLAQVFFFFDHLILLPREFPMSISRKSTPELKPFPFRHFGSPKRKAPEERAPPVVGDET